MMMSVEHRHLSPKQLVPKLADAGKYIASESTMYRLRRRAGLARRVLHQGRTHVTRAAKVHRADGPNQVWSWDITWLPTLTRGRYLYLYLIMDVWSRRIVGWRVHSSESADLAAALFRDTCDAMGIDPRGLVLHADNGSPMRGSTMVCTLQWLGVIPSFSRPHVSNDNPYSESLFRTLKYAPAYPGMFATEDAASHWVETFVRWYNTEHRHSGIRYVTPDHRHTGADVAILAKRVQLYAAARSRNPRRWTGKTRDWSSPISVALDPQAGLRRMETKEASATRLAGASRWPGTGTKSGTGT